LFKRNLILVILLLTVLALVTACGGGQQAAAPSGGGDAKPVQKITWELATTWPDSIMIQQMPVKFAEIINATSGGRLEVQVHPAGALLPAGEVLDAATAGTVDGYHTFSGYWMGKMAGAPFFSSVPMTMEPFMHLTWVYEGGGLELWQKMYDQAGYNVKVLPVGIQHPETLAWSNKPLSKVEDWKGLKYRTVGWWGEILRNNDVAVASLPAAELYPSLERGVLDATEFSSPYNDKVLGFYEVTKYMTGPGMHQPGVLFYVGINKDSWNALPADLQKLVEESARAATLWSWVYDFDQSMDAVDYFKSKGQEFITVDEAVQLKIQQDTWAILDARSKEQGGVFAEIWTSMKEYRARFIEYENFMMPVRGKTK
jgi:TRAP-type mannitol/chloroaromatic compound transport system substrate-binding protein